MNSISRKNKHTFFIEEILVNSKLNLDIIQKNTYDKRKQLSKGEEKWV